MSRTGFLTRSPDRTTLFDRIGGVDLIDRVSRGVLDRIEADSGLRRLLVDVNLATVTWQLQMFLTDLMAGPVTYDGPSPASLGIGAQLHRHEFDRLANILQDALRGAGVPEPETADVIAAFIPFADGMTMAIGGSGTPITEIERLVEAAARQAELDGVSGDNLFVADLELNLVHLNGCAKAALQARDSELRRAFGLGAADLPGTSLLRFHPAPTQLQALLRNTAALPYETLWSFGRVVWKARIGAIPDGDGVTLGFLVSWEDVSERQRHAAAMQRVWALAEELPVPVMYPETGLETWRGNPACVHAFQRLEGYLPAKFDPAAGIPIEIFFPDPVHRAEVFSGPDRLPHKERLIIGPETIAVLVSAVRGQEKEYLGPQITWEFITHLESRAVPAPSVADLTVVPVGDPQSPLPPRNDPVLDLRAHARRFARAAEEMVSLSRLLDTVADEAGRNGHSDGTPVEPAALQGLARSGEQAALAARAAVRIVGTARDAADILGRTDSEAARLLRSLAAFARETNLLALDATLSVTRDATQAELSGLAGVAGELGAQLDLSLGALLTRAEQAAASVRDAREILGRVAEIRESYPGDADALVPA